MPENTALPWNTDSSAIPIDKPVLVRQKDEQVPFMATRSDDFEPDCVGCLLGPSKRPYGFYTPLVDIEAWLDVMP